jgi:hypothetical protein
MFAAGELVAIEPHRLHDLGVDEAHDAAADANTVLALDLTAEFGIIAEAAEIEPAKDLRRVDLEVAEKPYADEPVAIFVDKSCRSLAINGLAGPFDDFVNEDLTLLSHDASVAPKRADDIIHFCVREAPSGEGPVAHLRVAFARLHEDVLAGALGRPQAHGVEHALEVFSDEVERRGMRTSMVVLAAGLPTLASVVALALLPAGHSMSPGANSAGNGSEGEGELLPHVTRSYHM